jgi:hypothetical protein
MGPLGGLLGASWGFLGSLGSLLGVLGGLWGPLVDLLGALGVHMGPKRVTAHIDFYNIGGGGLPNRLKSISKEPSGPGTRTIADDLTRPGPEARRIYKDWCRGISIYILRSGLEGMQTLLGGYRSMLQNSAN